MARERGTEVDDSAPEEAQAGSTAPPPKGTGSGAAGEPPPGLPDALRRLVALGLTGVFSTQESIRKSVGDALPKEWVDFAADQSDRTRAEFLERLAGELARAIENIDLARVMQQALEGRTLEVHARIRMLPDDEASPGGSGGLKISMREDDPS